MTYVFVRTLAATSVGAVADHVRPHLAAVKPGPRVAGIVLAVSGEGFGASSTQTVGLGVRATTLHNAIAQLVGLPDGWRDAQAGTIKQALAGVSAGGHPRLAELYVSIGGQKHPASAWLDGTLSWNTTAAPSLVYVQAEAGKGKTTLLADYVRRSLQRMSGPLPLFVRLRDIAHGHGVSWEGMASTLGVVGGSCDTLAAAVTAGLVLLALDGLDEVSGRYDPETVRQVLTLAREKLLRRNSTVAISGRTTEAKLLDRGACTIADIELPEPHETAFRDYASQVTEAMARELPQLAPRLPEPFAPESTIPSKAIDRADLDLIVEWIQGKYNELGKDRSLFFVQSLACLGVLLLYTKGRVHIAYSGGVKKYYPVDLQDVCSLAVALACAREQTKLFDTDRAAGLAFAPPAQVDLLTCLSLFTSAMDASASSGIRPNDFIPSLFAVDPVHENEQFTSIARQIQKHALLFASDAGVAAGDWTPRFLSDWVRCSLLVRGLCRRKQLAHLIPEAKLLRMMATAGFPKYAYQVLFSMLPAAALPDAVSAIAPELVTASRSGSPEACANFWSLVIGLDEDQRSMITTSPTNLVPLCELSESQFVGCSFGPEFGGSSALFVGSEFLNCTFKNCELLECDFSGAAFRDCSFESAFFGEVDGPILFADCLFSGSRIRDARAGVLPALQLENCDFRNGSNTLQSKPAGDPNRYGPIAHFSDCRSDSSGAETLSGEWPGFDPESVDGLSPRGAAPPVDEPVACLRGLLRTFFPRRAGVGLSLQARGYIRSSAIGRGNYPTGALTRSDMIEALESVGFSRGGRQGHLYAPWSGVGGASSVDLRNEMLAFLRDDQRGARIRALLDRLRRTGWAH